MKLTVVRYYDDGKTTSGLLFIDGKFEAFTVEDTHHDVKIKGETCIPEGEYKLGLRTEGTHHTEYLKKFPKDHIGMLHVLNVPNFQFILIHVGNSKDSTEGCLLVGNQITKQGVLIDSTGAYLEMYKKVAPQTKNGVTIKYTKCL